MKRLLFILSALLTLTRADGQDFASGAQEPTPPAAKNTTVDYATGIFHYRLPLCELQSGNLKLPLSLDYTGSGVRQETSRGLLGYNWSLNAGGAVTRKVRGFSDDSSTGISPITPVEDPDRMRKEYLDGECDIYTATFNGKSVDFIRNLSKSGEDFVPLERTNVRIKYQTEEGGWLITDGDGTRYYYRAKEWNSRIQKEGAVSVPLSDLWKDYVSAWHLTRIRPVNGDDILFNYSGTVDPATGAYAHAFSQECRYSADYSYGHPMVEYLFGRSSRMSLFDGYIQRAQNLLEGYSLKVRLENPKYVFSSYQEWVLNPRYEVGNVISGEMHRVIGVMASLRGIGEGSTQLLTALGYFISDLRQKAEASHSPILSSAASELENARKVVYDSMADKREVTGKGTSDITGYTVYAPVLKSVTCKGRTLNMAYTGQPASLSKISICDLMGNTVGSVAFTVSRDNLLEKVSFRDGASEETESVSFDYYNDPSVHGYNYWGDPARLPWDTSLSDVRNLSLKSVRSVHGGRLTVDYSLNERSAGMTPSTFPPYALPELSQGGLRVASLVLEDSCQQYADSILYSYPLPGITVYDEITRLDYLVYGTAGTTVWKDEVALSRMKLRGPASTRTGNNGLYYPYVVETTRGKGTRAYLFHVPTRGGWESPYAFWLNGLPLAVASYDKEGHLRKLVRNKYSTDLSFNRRELERMLGGHAGYFEDGGALCHYADSFPQLARYDYLIDFNQLKEQYKNMPVIHLDYREIDPYLNIYVPNFGGREKMRIPDWSYRLYHGGATLLKERVEYRYESDVTDSVGYADFEEKAAGIPFRTTGYHYPETSILPDRIDENGPENDTLSTVFVRASDMGQSADSLWIRMKQYNLLSPTVKRRNLKNGILLSETVYDRRVEEADSCLRVSDRGEFAYIPSVPSRMEETGVDSCLFTYGASGYHRMKGQVYAEKGRAYVPVEISSRDERYSFSYDHTGTLPTLKARNTDSRRIATDDISRVVMLEKEKAEADSCGICYDIACRIDSNPVILYFLTFYGQSLYEYFSEMIHILRTPVTADNGNRFYELRGLLEKDPLYPKAIASVASVLGKHPEWNVRPDELTGLVNHISRPYFFVTSVQSWSRFDGVAALSPVEVTAFPSSGRLEVCFLTKGAETTLSCVVTHAGGETRIPLSCRAADHWTVQVREIDINPYTSVSSVRLEEPEKVRYTAIVPAGTEFEATSYNPDRTVFARFDRNGLLEQYDYDKAGRPARVTDGHGDVWKEYEYKNIEK